MLDLTAMWAGPLCTLLLAEWGATGDDDRAGGAARRAAWLAGPVRRARPRASGASTSICARRRAGRRSSSWSAESDVLVESFSARVMPNLGYGADELRRDQPAPDDGGDPRLRRTATGWPTGAACTPTSGLGMHAGRPQPASIAYPDPLTGFAAFAAALRALGADEPPALTTVSLASTIAPLLAGGPAPAVGGRPVRGGPPRRLDRRGDGRADPSDPADSR